MNRLGWIIILWLASGFWATESLAQLRLSGYYENTLQADRADGGEDALLDASKLRLDLAAGGAEDELSFTGNLNVIHYHTALTLDLEPYLPDPVLARMRSFGLEPELAVDRSRVELNNAWITWIPTDAVRVRLGRQQLTWGPGISTNPTDLFHDKTLIDPAYEKTGVTALRADYRWGLGGQLSGVWTPGGDFRSSGYALRAASWLPSVGYDVAITAHAVTDTTSLDPITLQPVRQQRYALGGDLAGSLVGLGVWLEGNWNWMEAEEDFARLLAGVDYTLPGGLYLLAEAYYNGRGESDPPYSLQAWLESLLYGETVGRGWLMLGSRYDLSLLVAGMLYGFVAPDGSLLVNPRIQWSIGQNADLTVFGAYTIGEEDGAFPPGRLSGFLRATVYF